MGLKYRTQMLGSIWYNSFSRYYGDNVLAGFYQCRNGDGIDAGCGCPVAVYQLRRLIALYDDDLYGDLAEY